MDRWAEAGRDPSNRGGRASAAAWTLVLLLAILLGGTVAVGRVGALDAARTQLSDARFSLVSRAVGPGTVLVAIDPASLESVAVWPWPRRVHGMLIERLEALGAGEIHFDVDFSSPSNAEDDAAFEAALAAASVPVTLAGHAQATREGLVERVPLPRFARHAATASVTVRPSADGLTRHAERGRLLGGAPTPSLPTVLAGLEPEPDAFPIDYSIDPSTVPRVSVAAVLDGAAEPELIAGARVVIGATAVELGDMVAVPRHGVVPGALVQIAAGETLAQDRVVGPVGWASWAGPAMALALGVVLLFAMARGRLGLGRALLVLAAALAALWMIDAIVFVHHARTLPTLDVTLILILAATCCTVEEITRRRALARAEAARAENARRVLDRVVTDNFDAIIVAAEDGTILWASAVARHLAHEVLGTDLSKGTLASMPSNARTALLAPARLLREGRWEERGVGALRLADRDGRDRHVEYVVTPSWASLVGEGGQRVIVTLTMRDVTARETARRRTEWLARHDEPSGALKPHALRALIDESRSGAGAPGALIAFDLRRFDTVRRTLGRGKANALLARVVRGLTETAAVRGVARTGDGEFSVWVDGGTDAAATVRSAVRAALARASGPSTRMAVPAGTVALSDHASTAEAMEAAIVAKEHAVERGDAVVAHEPAMSEAARRRLVQEADLADAIAANLLDVHYQPQIDLATGNAVGVEALVRWNHPALGPVPPNEFVAVAEASGRIAELGAWVLERACREIRRVENPAGPLRLSVNVSPQQFLQSDVSAMIESALERTGFPPHRLELEITESLAVRDPRMVGKALKPWQERGVAIALDDFGTGYAQLGVLRDLPLDWIKLDRSLIAPLPSAEATSLVAAALTIARGHGLRAVAEGIENARTAELLRGAGCHVGQGFHWSRPLPLADLKAWLAARSAGPSDVPSVPEVAHPR